MSEKGHVVPLVELRQVRRDQARAALLRAMLRRGGSLIGTPLRERYARQYRSSSPANATTFWGAEMEVALPELVSCELYEHGVIEPALTALFTRASASPKTRMR